MKNKLNKFLTGSFLVALLLVNFSSAQMDTSNSVVLDTDNPSVSTFDTGHDYTNYNNMRSNADCCGKRGERMSYYQDSWKSLMPAFVAGFMGIGILFGMIGILFLAFWIWMLVHAVTHDIKHKPLWILLIWFMHIIGAIIYFFVIKKNLDKENRKGCGCGGACGKGVCVCSEENDSE